jgi:hypothetical protein
MILLYMALAACGEVSSPLFSVASTQAQLSIRPPVLPEAFDPEESASAATVHQFQQIQAHSR